jgi:hypothetical protein
MPDYPANWTPLANDAADSAWRGKPMSAFYKGGRVGTKPVSIRMPKEHVEKFAKGGLASEAARVAHSGVGGDTMVIHINKDEFNKLREQWGEPTINPHTGMPQFTPFWKQDWFAPVAALAGTALMATGIGAPIGTALLGEALAGTTLAGATGIGALGTTTLGTLATNAAIGAGIGGLTGGWKGAAKSAGLAGLGTVGASAFGNYMGTSPAAVSSGKGEYGSIYAGADADPMTYLDAGADKILANNATMGEYPYHLEDKGIDAYKLKDSSGSGIMDSLKGYASDPNKMAAAALVLGDMAEGSGQPQQADIPGTGFGTKNSYMNVPLNTSYLARTRAPDPSGYYKYGKMPERNYFRDNSIAQEEDQPTVQAARGGPLTQYVQGGGTGRSDSINAKLSDGEYIIDAETVALLGDGSSKAGAQKLDQFRANVRKQKGRALSQGQISPDAKSPEHYLMGGRA